MSEIKAIIRTERLDDVLQAIRSAGSDAGITVSTIEGFGRAVRLDVVTDDQAFGRVEMSKVETVIAHTLVPAVIDAIVSAARTGRPGDGKIFVSAIDQAVDIRTGTVAGLSE